MFVNSLFAFPISYFFFFFFNDTATTEIYTLSLHDALPIFDDEPGGPPGNGVEHSEALGFAPEEAHLVGEDRKSTRLNSSHSQISYAVFCVKQTKSSGGHGCCAACTRQRCAA